MTGNLIIQGRCLEASQLQGIRTAVAAHPQWSRWRLSRELASAWEWRNGAGQLKDMAARTLLVKLEQRGLIKLPARRQVPTNRMRCPLRASGAVVIDPAPVAGTLGQLGPVSVSEVSTEATGRAWVRAVLGRFHYLGFGGTVGENLQYVIRTADQRPLGCLVFGAAAWKCQDRDRWIGWSAAQRQRHLRGVANNTRFLILPWVQVPQLGSWVLGQVARRIGRDWQAKYGHAVVLLETFVERERFTGAVYRAANWHAVGVTAGRTRQDRHTCLQVPVKDIYLYALRRDFRAALAP